MSPRIVVCRCLRAFGGREICFLFVVFQLSCRKAEVETVSA